MSQKRILEFLSYAGVGGTQQMVLEFLRRASREKYECVVCVLLEYGFVNDEVSRLGIENTALNMRGYEDLFAWWRLYRFAKKKNFELIRTYGLKAHIIGRIVGRWLGIPVNISSIRNVDPWRTWFHARLDELTSGLTDLYISNSEAGRQATHRREHIPLSKIITIPNGIDVAAFRKTAEFSGPDELREYKNSLGISEEDRVIGIVANLRPQKGHDTIINALPTILGQFPNTKCLFIGRNDFPDNDIHQLVKEKQLERTVIFTGIRKDIARLLSICELFMLPSLWEGFPTVVIEAMAMGLPIIATPVGDIPDIVVPQQTGILIPPKNPNVLVETALEFLKNPENAQKMGQAGYERVRQHFSIDAMVRQTEEIYDRLLKQKTL